MRRGKNLITENIFVVIKLCSEYISQHLEGKCSIKLNRVFHSIVGVVGVKSIYWFFPLIPYHFIEWLFYCYQWSSNTTQTEQQNAHRMHENMWQNNFYILFYDCSDLIVISTINKVFQFISLLGASIASRLHYFLTRLFCCVACICYVCFVIVIWKWKHICTECFNIAH